MRLAAAALLLAAPVFAATGGEDGAGRSVPSAALQGRPESLEEDAPGAELRGPAAMQGIENSSESAGRDVILRGPLKVSADETVSKQHGKVFEASGRVKVRYEMENGDRMDSLSDRARFDEEKKMGELTGSPRAVWQRADPSLPETRLKADRIRLHVESEAIEASGRVVVEQSSSILRAEEMRYVNADRRLLASGGRPEFDVRQEAHHTVISAEEIVAWTDKRQIDFNRRVRGIVELKKGPDGKP